jgi:hypothetical protein
MNTWIAIAIYGCMFEGRAQHQIGHVNDETLILCGGIDRKSLCPTTQISFITFSNNHSINNTIDEYEIKRELHKFKDVQRLLDIRSR